MKNLSLIILFVAAALPSLAQQKPVRIVFDVSSKDSLVHQAAMRHVSGMAKAYPDSKFEVVVYGGALPMFVKDQSTVSKTISALAGNKNVSFKVCEVTMKRYNVERSQLLPNVEPVPDAIIEIVTKQGEGWGYIKEAHN
jgi:intracellular sulfur oxidation DsrE/DsrF family protein